MKMPNGAFAVVEVEKLRDYCLNPDHLRGRHKARVFAAALGLILENTEELRIALVDAARTDEAAPMDQDEYGQRYILDFIMHGPKASGKVRSSWIIRNGEDFPRLTSCYVL